ncbi:MAG: TerC family protein [Candidatus Eiseniibacteriota bacterium]
MEWIADPGIWLSLLTLTILEIVLGIDNLIFLAILADRLPRERQAAARRLGLAVALITRLALLFAITWIIGLTAPLFTVLGNPFSWRDIILIGGGLFLIMKGTFEIHHKVEGEGESVGQAAAATVSFAGVVIQIGIMDIVFSLDSVITAVGMADHIEVMVAAVVIAIVVMLIASEPVSAFVNRHPTVKMLALSFLLLIGMALVADGFEFHIPKGYIYFAMGFSIFVEMLNMAVRRRAQRVPERSGG